MPPGPVFNWLAVAHSALVILDHALQFRAAQVARVGGIRASQSLQRARDGGMYENGKEAKGVVKELVTRTADESPSGPTYVQPSSLLHANDAWLSQLEIAATTKTSLPETVSEQQLRDTTAASTLLEPSSTFPTTAEAGPPAAEPLVLAADVNLSRLDVPSSQHLSKPESDTSPDDVLLHCHLNFPLTLKPVLLQVFAPRLESSRHLQSSKVPSSRIGRLFHYGGIYPTCHSHLPVQILGLMFRLHRPRSIPWLWRSF
jgi:hypothetical protein